MNTTDGGGQSPAEFGEHYLEFLTCQTRNGGLYLEERYLGPLIAQFLGDIADARVFEFGCGPGHNTARLLRLRPRRIRAIDLSPEGLPAAEAATMALEAELNRTAPLRRDGQVVCKFAAMDASDLDREVFKDDHYNAGCSIFVLENMPDNVVEGSLAEAYRTLTPGGVFVCGGVHPLWFLLVSGGNEVPMAERFRRHNEPHKVTVERTERHRYYRQYRPTEWYLNAAHRVGFTLERIEAVAVPSRDDDPQLEIKYGPKQGWPVFWLMALRKPK